MAGPKETARIRQIAILMRDLRWNTETRFALAEKWGLREPTVRKYSAAASKLIQSELEDDQETRGVAAAALRKIAADCETFARAMHAKKPQIAVNALKVKLEAIRTIAALCGLNAPQQHEVRMVTEALKREHDQMFDRLERRLPHEVFQQVLEALSEDDGSDAARSDLPSGGSGASSTKQ
jgi:hypothetical protein